MIRRCRHGSGEELTRIESRRIDCHGHLWPFSAAGGNRPVVYGGSRGHATLAPGITFAHLNCLRMAWHGKHHGLSCWLAYAYSSCMFRDCFCSVPKGRPQASPGQSRRRSRQTSPSVMQRKHDRSTWTASIGAHAAETETERGLFRSRHTAVVFGRANRQDGSSRAIPFTPWKGSPVGLAPCRWLPTCGCRRTKNPGAIRVYGRSIRLISSAIQRTGQAVAAVGPRAELIRFSQFTFFHRPHVPAAIPEPQRRHSAAGRCWGSLLHPALDTKIRNAAKVNRIARQ